MTAASSPSTEVQPRRAQVSMIPVYLRHDETDSTRRTSLPSSPRPLARDSNYVENLKTPKDSSRDWYHGSPNARLSNSPRSNHAPRFGETDGCDNDNWSRKIYSEKPDPRRILAALSRLVRPGESVSGFLDIDQLMAIHEQELTNTSERRANKRQVDQSKAAVFGVPLNEASKYAFTSALFNGHELHLPLVVFDCVEELYRTGIYKEDLFRVLPNRQRLSQLTHIFNSPNPHLNYRSKNPRSRVAEYNTTLLHLESTQDICALLTDYLCSLPEPILSPYLFDAIWEWAGVGNDEDDDDDPRVGGDAASFIREGQRRQDFVPLAKTSSEPSEATRINIVQHLLCLLPSANFSLIVYLLAFFSHVIMTQDVNGMSIQDLSRLFGRCVFGVGRFSKNGIPVGERSGQVMMPWFLKRWSPISNGLFDVIKVKKRGQQAEAVARRVKPKSPIDFNSRPSPSAWSSKKRCRDDLDWSTLLRSPKDLGIVMNTTLPNVHFVDSSIFPSEATQRGERRSDVLNGPAISRRISGDSNVIDDEQRLSLSEQPIPSAMTLEKRPAPSRLSTTLSEYSTDAIDERLLDVSLSPSFSDLYFLESMKFGDLLPRASGAFEEAKPSEDRCTLAQTPNTADELGEAHRRIRRLERQIEKNDTMVCEALRVLLRAKVRIDEIDGCLDKLEETLRVRRGDPSAHNLAEASSDRDRAFKIVGELRKLMTREL